MIEGPAAAVHPSSAPTAHPVFAAVQMCSTEDVDANLTRCTALVRQAATRGAQFIGLPENFAYLGAAGDHKLALAEDIDHPGVILTSMQELARSCGIHLLLGGFPERLPGAGRIGNTSVLLAPSGQIAARYRKVHLFDVEVPGGQVFRESDHVAAGETVVVTDLPWGRVGLSICYDLRFPELYREQARQGARFLTVPAAFTKQTGPDHWQVLLRARAIENQAFVVAPAQWGQHGGQRVSYGHAMIVDPWGAVIAECGDHEGIAIAALDLAYQDQVRQRLPCLSHRRLS